MSNIFYMCGPRCLQANTAKAIAAALQTLSYVLRCSIHGCVALVIGGLFVRLRLSVPHSQSAGRLTALLIFFLRCKGTSLSLICIIY